MKHLLYFFLFLSVSAFSQITITSSDINAQFTPGNSSTSHTDTITSSVDIGQLGATSWDFSGLTSHLAFPFTAVDPASTPYHSSYPGTNIGSLSETNYNGVIADIYSYLSVNGSLNWHGTIIETEFDGMSTTISTTTDPSEPSAIFPFTNNSTIDNFNSERTVITETDGFPPFTSIITVERSIVVDAYGPMTLPGGTVVDALRIKEDELNIIQGPFPIYSRNIAYIFVTKDGSQLNVPSDTVQATTGVINNTASISWNESLTVDVELMEDPLTNYSLNQNYPNPFNTSTNIEYSIPKASLVRLKVFDVLGNEITTLVNQEQAAGIHHVNLSGSDLVNGIYFARITAGNFTRTIHMNLMK